MTINYYCKYLKKDNKKKNNNNVTLIKKSKASQLTISKDACRCPGSEAVSLKRKIKNKLNS